MRKLSLILPARYDEKREFEFILQFQGASGNRRSLDVIVRLEQCEMASGTQGVVAECDLGCDLQRVGYTMQSQPT